MSKIKIGRELETLGEELTRKCPNNECRVFRDTYSAYKNMIADRVQLLGYVSPATMKAIEHQIVKAVAKMYDLYHHNAAIQAYIQRNQDILTKRYLA